MRSKQFHRPNDRPGGESERDFMIPANMTEGDGARLLEVLRKYWHDRIQRKRETAKKMAENGEYALAHRLSVEADATELCLKDIDKSRDDAT